MNDELKKTLGLHPGDQLEKLQTWNPTAEEGVQEAASAPVFAALLQLLSGLPSIAEPINALPAVHPFESNAGLVLIDSETAPAVVKGELASHPQRGFVLDGRSEGGIAIFDRGEDQLVVTAEPDGRIEVFSLQRASSLDGWSPIPADVGSPPDTATLLDGCTCPLWLTHRLESLAAADNPFDAVALVGTIARFWRPASNEELRSTLRSGRFPPMELARAWAASLGAAQVGEVRQQALLVVEEAHDLLEDLLTAEANDAPLLARALAERRDALESVSGLFHATDIGVDLEHALQELDDAATDRWSELPEAGCLDDEWLIEVAVAQPDAWWGAWALA